MDFDRNQFLTDVFEEILSRPGDPVRQIDHAIARAINSVTVELNRLAQAERENLLTMAEERRKNPHAPVKTLWRYSYDRRAVNLAPILGPGVKSFPEAKALLKEKGRAHTIVTDRQTGLLHVVRNLDLSKLGGGRFVQEMAIARPV